MRYKNNTVIDSAYNNITYQSSQISFNPYKLNRFANITIEDNYITGYEVWNASKLKLVTP